MAILAVRFQNYTSREWICEKLTDLGLKLNYKLSADSDFVLVFNLNSCRAVVRVPDKEEVKISRDLRSIPRAVEVKKMNVGL